MGHRLPYRDSPAFGGGASGDGNFVKLPCVDSFCHHWTNCKKNADNSSVRKSSPVKMAGFLKFPLNKSDHVHFIFISVGMYFSWTPINRLAMECDFDKLAKYMMNCTSCRQSWMVLQLRYALIAIFFCFIVLAGICVPFSHSSVHFSIKLAIFDRKYGTKTMQTNEINRSRLPNRSIDTRLLVRL